MLKQDVKKIINSYQGGVSYCEIPGETFPCVTVRIPRIVETDGDTFTQTCQVVLTLYDRYPEGCETWDEVQVCDILEDHQQFLRGVYFMLKREMYTTDRLQFDMYPDKVTEMSAIAVRLQMNLTKCVAPKCCDLDLFTPITHTLYEKLTR